MLGVILTLVGIYVILYVTVSIPAVQRGIKSTAERELSALLGSRLDIGDLHLSPFNQVILRDVNLYTPEPKEELCAHIDKVAAGISIWQLLSRGKIHVTYGEIMGLDARIWQEKEGEPLNIQFIIDAFAPKDPNKPPTQFDLRLSSIVIRGSKFSFDKRWIPGNRNPQKIDFNHLRVTNFQGDINIPRLKNDDFDFDIRRIALKERSGLDLRNLSARVRLTDKELKVSDLKIEFPNTCIAPDEIIVRYQNLKELGDAVKNSSHTLRISEGKVTPADFASFFPPLRHLDTPFEIDLDVEGDLKKATLHHFRLESAEELELALNGSVTGLDNPKMASARLNGLNLYVNLNAFTAFLNSIEGLNDKTLKGVQSLKALESLKMTATGSYTPESISYKGVIESAIGNVDLVANAKGSIAEKRGVADIKIRTPHLQLGKVFPELGLEEISIDGDIALNVNNTRDPLLKKAPHIDGAATVEIPYMKFRGTEFSAIDLDVMKKGSTVEGSLNIVSEPATGDIVGIYTDEGVNVTAHIEQFIPSAFGLTDNRYLNFRGNADINLAGRSLSDMTGDVSLTDLWAAYGAGKEISTRLIEIKSHVDEEDTRYLTLDSEFVTGKVSGRYQLDKLPDAVLGIIATVAPSWVPEKWGKFDYSASDMDLQYNFLIAENDKLPETFNLPIKLLTEIPVKGRVNTAEGVVTSTIDIPYLQQGAKNIIHDTRVDLVLNGNDKNGNLDISTVFLGKNDDISLNVTAAAKEDELNTDISWDFNRKRAYRGNVSLVGTVANSIHPEDGSMLPQKIYSVSLRPSDFQVNDTTWNIAAGNIRYRDKLVEVNNVTAYRDQQYVYIDGRASAFPGDTLTVSLRDIDLDYIFETLRINYVNFGGKATGEVKATNVFTATPVAFTDNLFVKGLKYNGAVLGDAKMKSSWRNDEKEVTIFADIAENGRRTAIVDGGIWVTRDSLSFDFDADRVNAKFMEPFFMAFASDISGRASGQLKLYGTFADINLIGKAKGDSIGLKVNYTNTKYFGSDSVYMTPGKIIVPNFRLYDKYGNSGILSGVVSHYYFHEPKFEFVVKDCEKLLCFDTDATINPRWYGRIFGNGGGTIKGDPSFVRIDVDMATAPGSNFTFVLDEKLEALDYEFLTFTDKRKEALEKAEMKVVEEDRLESYVNSLRNKVKTQEKTRPAIFSMDLRGTITRDALFTLVMDPVAGDNIVCHGSGAMNIYYSDENDDFTMNGKYTLEDGTYKFSLQDLILKEFQIRSGSTISFTGDPYKANLDIDAIYKVNTNIADLDKSFATDRELNRTNVPVEAVLKVEGELQSPEIKFDIELPTLTQDVARKVKSIISTDDMMSMQIIYLLALGRFYAPEYMSGTQNGSGSEFTAIASTTLSSQLSNMLSQINNNLSITPSFRSDKGNFSDFEFDLGVSSKFFNNRLLVNGNFGYRDKNTSTTTFIGDFDLEYLLNRRGNLRLKAYNHFNDQNYYLKSALTTQGIGVMLKHDFNNIRDLFGKPRKTEINEKLTDN